MRPAFILVIALSSACVAGQSDDGAASNVGFGGAQDIGQFRAILDDGEIPGEVTLDANGFFSEHFTELPLADCGQTMCLHGMLAVGRDWLTDQYQAALQISMSSPVDPTQLERLPLNLIVVVDTSGSMSSDNRLTFVKQGLHLLVDQLEDGDRLGLVRYSDNAEVIGEIDVVAELDRESLHAQVSDLVARGSTNIHEGLAVGFAQAESAFDPERQNRVILLSDGLATAGITDDQSILDLAVDKIARGIGLTTIGVGQSFNVELMRGLAERGAGNFYFLESPEAVEEVFVDELKYFVTPLALGVSIEAVSGSAYDLGEVVGTRLWKSRGESGSVFIPGVFIASRTDDEPDPNGRRGGGGAIIIAMLPKDGGFDNPSEVAEIRMTYRLPGSADLIEQTLTVTNPADPGIVPDEDIYLSHQAMAEHYAAYNIFLGLREASRLAAFDYSCAMAVLTKLEKNIALWNREFDDDDIAADRALVQQFIGNLESKGAIPGSEAELCVAGSLGQVGFGDDVVDQQVVCSISGTSDQGPAIWAMLALALGLAVRRRR